MVGPVQLVLNEHQAVVLGIPGEDVRREPVDLYLGVFQDHLDANSLGQPFQVLRQPRGEIEGLVLPRCTEVHGLKPAKFIHGQTPSLPNVT